MLRHAPWLYEMHYDGDFYVFFVTHDRKNQKNCFDFDDDALRWSQSPTSTTDAILGRFLQMTSRWKALVKLEPVRPLTGSVAVVARLRPRNGRSIPRRPSGLSSRQREFFCRQPGGLALTTLTTLTTLMALMDLIYPD